jgi:hypothetical protein
LAAFSSLFVFTYLKARVPERLVKEVKEEMVGPKEEIVAPKEEMVGPKEEMVGPKEEMVGPKEEMVGPKDSKFRLNLSIEGVLMKTLGLVEVVTINLRKKSFIIVISTSLKLVINFWP